MSRFSRGAIVGSEERGWCDMKIYSESHSCPHRRNSIFTGGSPNVFFEGVAAIREGDGGTCGCPHSGSFKASEGSGTVFINGKAAVRIKDETTCTQCGEEGYVTTACQTVFVGD